jgi:hypothetical protein
MSWEGARVVDWWSMPLTVVRSYQCYAMKGRTQAQGQVTGDRRQATGSMTCYNIMRHQALFEVLHATTIDLVVLEIDVNILGTLGP